MAEGSFPYQTWHTPFEQLRLVVEGPAPVPTPGKFSPKFTQFLNICLQKSVEERAGYDDLLQHPFILEREDNFDIGSLDCKSAGGKLGKTGNCSYSALGQSLVSF